MILRQALSVAHDSQKDSSVSCAALSIRRGALFRCFHIPNYQRNLAHIIDFCQFVSQHFFDEEEKWDIAGVSILPATLSGLILIIIPHPVILRCHSFHAVKKILDGCNADRLARHCFHLGTHVCRHFRRHVTRKRCRNGLTLGRNTGRKIFAGGIDDLNILQKPVDIKRRKRRQRASCGVQHRLTLTLYDNKYKTIPA